MTDRRGAKLRRLALLERVRSLIVPASVVAAFSLFAGILLLFMPAQSDSVAGVVVTLTASQTDEGAKPLMLVELADGTVVRATLPRRTPYQPGAQVELVKTTSITGAVSYRLRRYVQ